MKIRVKSLIITTILILSCFCSISYAGRVDYLTTRLPYAVNYTPQVDVFKFVESGEEFILLDYDEDGFFVTTKNLMGTHAYDPNTTGKFDIYDENNIAYWLNNDFIYNGNTDEESGISRELPNVILKHIKEHDWICEAGNGVSDFPEDYVVRAKLALMSLTEYKKYAAKIGSNDNLDVSLYYFMRTVNGTKVDSPIMVMYPGGTVNYGKAWQAYGVRPVFYLERDVFISDKLNLIVTGGNVRKKLRDVYTREELSLLYTSQEIDMIYEKVPPQITEITISGIQRAGKTLQLNYKYISPEEEPEGETIIRWLRSKKSGGPYAVIKNANEKEYKLTNDDAGYYISCEVVPVSNNKRVGLSKKSTATSTTVKASTVPYAEDVKILGNTLVGERLIASYKYMDNNDSMESGTVVRWQKSKDNVDYEDIAGETTANLIIPSECAGYYIRCIVTVHNEVEAGADVVSKPIGPVDGFPQKEKPIIEYANDAIVLRTYVGKNDKVLWFTQTDNGNMGISQYGNDKYTLKGTETAIKAVVIFYSDSGIACGVEVSDILALKNIENNYMANTSIRTSNGENVTITPVGEQLAYSLKIVLSINGVTIRGAKSDTYSVYSHEENGRVVYILTKKSIDGADVPNSILNIETEGNGEIKIETAEAVYEANIGEFTKYEPKLSLVGGNV